jgi:hypothetical protein
VRLLNIVKLTSNRFGPKYRGLGSNSGVAKYTPRLRANVKENRPVPQGQKESDLDDFKIITKIIAYFNYFI